MPHPQLLVALTLGLLVAALSIAARRLRIATPHSHADRRRSAHPGARSSPGGHRFGPGFAGDAATAALFLWRGNELAWIPRQSRSHPVPGHWLRAGHRGGRGNGGTFSARPQLAGGIVLGAIVSPPDAVAPMAILRRMPLPRRLHTVLEGESLVNDATALVILSFALAAVGSASFSLPLAALQFVAIVGGELAFGIIVGFLMLRLRHAVSDARAEVMLALATPFIAFWPPHAVGGSGVIACVGHGPLRILNGRKLIRPTTRLQGYFIWDPDRLGRRSAAVPAGRIAGAQRARRSDSGNLAALAGGRGPDLRACHCHPLRLDIPWQLRALPLARATQRKYPAQDWRQLFSFPLPDCAAR